MGDRQVPPRLVGVVVVVLLIGVWFANRGAGAAPDVFTGADELVFDFGSDDQGGEVEFYLPDLDERQGFANDTAHDIIDYHERIVFEGEHYVGFESAGSAASPSGLATSTDGLTWIAQPTTGLEGLSDPWGFVASNGWYATIYMDWGDGADSGVLLATSNDLSTWTARELPVPVALQRTIYPVDLDMNGSEVGVVLGTDDPEVAAVLFTGPINGELILTTIPGFGAPASIVGIGDGFAVGVQVAGDELPQTEIWASTPAGAWEKTAALPDDLVGELNAIGDTLVVTGSDFDSFEGFGAVSEDAGASWERVDFEAPLRDVLPGPAGLTSFDGKDVVFSSNGTDWQRIEDDRFGEDSRFGNSTGSGRYVEIWPIVVGEDELILSRSEVAADDAYSRTYFAIDLD